MFRRNFLIPSYILKTESAGSSETLVVLYRTAQRCIPEDGSRVIAEPSGSMKEQISLMRREATSLRRDTLSDDQVMR
jgi:hypothetical protein